ncbi:MAG: hypothetical protein LBS69_08535 [Prevotellaceae bacterium]|jgi:hypothetical protein|nr:hypothetical protein [Prevotellaceae bacterium]
MSKLYVFGIGGTGSRVLKSLTMLMAAGVKVQNAAGQCYEIVPIVIDPDHAAADLTRTVKLMRDYKKVRSKLTFNNASKNAFFSNEINLTVLSGNETENITMSLQDTLNTNFKTYIGLPLMRDEGRENANYALASMLFSAKNLGSTMDVGFKGNPNIGSVVLNQFSNSQEFIKFAASFNQGDRIFIISSIFGGTGASGFPLLLKNLRAISDEINGNRLIKVAPIGAVSVLPYFKVEPAAADDKKSQIDSSTFISKTKAALSYYDKNMNEANVLYYVGDNVFDHYNHSEGGAEQRNNAHFIELISALAIVDFAQIQDELLITNIDPNNNNGVPDFGSIKYKEFGIRDETNEIIFSNLDTSTRELIEKPMTQFVLFCKYLNEHIHDSKKGGRNQQTYAIDNNFDDLFLRSVFYQSYLNGVKTAYLEWLEEMGDNKRAFKPYELKLTEKKLFELVKGEKPRENIFGAKNYALFDSALNKQKTTGEKEQKFIEMFYNATEKLVTKEKFNMR